MHDHHPRYDRPDIGVRKPGKVILPEEREPERRGSKRLNLFVLVLLLIVGLTVLYYTVKEWGPGLMKKEAPVLLPPDGR
ncbi:MAG: hypothetical protein WCH40_00740 [Verrucomicrobiales bacterium]